MHVTCPGQCVGQFSDAFGRLLFQLSWVMG